jgi:deoxycytidine triphosphate deaminase
MYLRDADLVYLVKEFGMVRDFPSNEADHVEHNPYGANSPIQPASIDLHVGEIEIPVSGRDVGVVTLIDKYMLLPGHSVLVSTHECLKMPDDVGACAYPIAGRRQGPTLMLNPGPIDPGYEGRLWFSLINVGKMPIEFFRGMRIATLLFWKTSAPVKSNFKKRYGQSAGTGIPDRMIIELSGDTLMVGDRAKEVAQRVVEQHRSEMEKIRDTAKEHQLLSKVWATVLPLILVPLVGFLMTWGNNQFGEVSTQRASISNLNATIAKFDAELAHLQKDVSAIPPLQSEVQLWDTRRKLLDEVRNLEARIDAIEKPRPTTQP